MRSTRGGLRRELDEDRNLSARVDVSGNATVTGGGELQDAGDLEVLADFGDLVIQEVVYLPGSIGVVGLVEQVVDAVQGRLTDEVLGEGDEGFVLGDEVRFAIKFEERRGRTGGLDLNGEHTFAGLAVGLLVTRRDPLDAEDFDGLFHVGVGLSEGLLAIHETRAGTLAQLIDRLGGDNGHDEIT